MIDYNIKAVDFDGTLFTNKWPDIGEPNIRLIEYLKKQVAGGDVKLILWTCRVGEKLDAAVNACTEQGLHFDAINENLPEVIEEFGSDCRKIFAHEYIDDRSIHPFMLALTRIPHYNFINKEFHVPENKSGFIDGVFYHQVPPNTIDITTTSDIEAGIYPVYAKGLEEE